MLFNLTGITLKAKGEKLYSDVSVELAIELGAVVSILTSLKSRHPGSNTCWTQASRSTQVNTARRWDRRNLRTLFSFLMDRGEIEKGKAREALGWPLAPEGSASLPRC